MREGGWREGEREHCSYPLFHGGVVHDFVEADLIKDGVEKALLLFHHLLGHRRCVGFGSGSDPADEARKARQE